MSTVGYGDYLLAGFLKDFCTKSDPRSVLSSAIKVAAAKAKGWTESKEASQTLRRIRVVIG